MHKFESLFHVTHEGRSRWRWTWFTLILVIAGMVLSHQPLTITACNPFGWWAYALPLAVACFIAGKGWLFFAEISTKNWWYFRKYGWGARIIWYVICLVGFSVACYYWLDPSPWFPAYLANAGDQSKPECISNLPFFPTFFMMIFAAAWWLFLNHLLWMATGYLGIWALDKVIRYNNAEDTEEGDRGKVIPKVLFLDWQGKRSGFTPKGSFILSVLPHREDFFVLTYGESYGHLS